MSSGSLRARAEAIPEWAWVAAVVVSSAAVRVVLGREMVSPFVFVDEAVYSELARSLADSGSYAVRETPVSGYSLLYPALIAPAYGLFDNLVDAYGAAKATNAVVMSLAAIPTYLLGRRIAGRWLALLGAATAVSVPSMAYTATITTESLFYPVTLLLALVLVRYLERPTAAWLAVVVGALGLAYATRSQALAFVPALATAPLLLAGYRRRVGELRPFLPLYALGAAGTVAVVAFQVLRGHPLKELLGAYSIVLEGDYDVGNALRFWLWHLEELDLVVGVVPFAALLLLLVLGRSLPARVQAHVAATASLVVWSTLVVGVFASRFASDRIQDRYLFFLVPLLVVTLLAWVELGAPRPPLPAALAAGAALVPVLVFPYVRFIGEPAKSDTLGLIPLWTANEHLVAGRYWLTAGAAAAALLALWLAVPARLAVIAPLAVLALFALLSRPVWSGPHGFVAAGVGALRQGNPGLSRDWIDRRVPAGDEVVALYTGRADRFTVNVNEFFNRRIGRVFYTDTPTPGGFGELPVTRARDAGFPVSVAGAYVLPNDAAITAPYALLDGTVLPDGDVVARNELVGTVLWRLEGPLSNTVDVTGLYPQDTWSRSRVTWRRLRCAGGALTVTLHSDPTLFAGISTRVAAFVDRRRVAAVAVPPEGSVPLRVPLTPAGGTCTVRFAVSPTRVPAQVIPGAADERRLGVHFDSFAFEARP